MNTIFDTLCLRSIREQPALLLGTPTLSSMEQWIGGYAAACRDADLAKPLLTKNGLTILWLRDYIAAQENDRSTGGIAYILNQAAGGDERAAWERFFRHIDGFMKLEITGTRKMAVTEEMRRYAAAQQRFFAPDHEGKLIAVQFRVTEIQKTVLSNGFCFLEEARPEKGSLIVGILNNYLREPEAEAELLRLFGETNWIMESGR